MIGYIYRRIIQAVFVVFGVSVVVFLILHLSGDPVLLMVPMEATLEQIEQLREELGFNDPLLVQYYRFLMGAIRGDFGISLSYFQPALGLVLERIPFTMELAFWAILFAITLGVPLGVLAAVKKDTFIDFFARVTAILGQSIPGFWLGLMLILLFSVKLRWLPPYGRGTFSQSVMPIITVGTFSMAAITRLTRSAMLNILGMDYIRTARAKGLPQKVVLYKHALRNALLPIVTMVGLQMGQLLGGVVITESVFALPGLGRLALKAIYARDYPLVQAVVFISALVFVVINLVVDIIYSIIDPRIRYGR